MFKSIGNKFDKKATLFTRQSTKQQKAVDLIQKYIQTEFGIKNIATITVTYIPHESRLQIKTISKALSSALLLQSTELSSLLRAEGIPIKQLSIL